MDPIQGVRQKDGPIFAFIRSIVLGNPLTLQQHNVTT